MNVSLTPILFRELAAALRGVSFGAGHSLSASANAFCRRQRMDASRAFSSRRGGRLSRIWLWSASLTTQAFGTVESALKFGRASCSGPVLLPTPTPNNALQRTAALAVSFDAAALASTGSVTAYAPAMKPTIRRAFASRRRALTGRFRATVAELGAVRRSATRPVKNTFLFLGFCALTLLLDAADTPTSDAILYLRDAQAKSANLEVLDLELHEDGSFHNGSYKRTFDDIRHNFQLWRRDGGNDPLVILFLYPGLRSNGDLKRLREVAAFFDAEKVPWQFALHSPRDPIPIYLRSKPLKHKR